MGITPPEIWLRKLVAAEEAGLANGAERRSFMLLYTGGMQRQLDHPGWDDSWEAPTQHDIDDLIAAGWVRLDSLSTGNERVFSLTAEGRARVQRAERAHQHPGRLPVSMDWSTLEPVLHAAITAYEQAGAPEGGVHVSAVALREGATSAAVAELARVGLLIDAETEDAGIGGSDQVDGPAFVRPSIEAYRLCRAWPRDAADAAVDRLVQALLEQAKTTEDPGERTRMERTAAWLGRVGTDIITGVGTGLGTSVATGGHLF